ncbi:MAG: hypothetical protein Q4C49_00080 [Bacillota bacterium]|nr:hypothetical protein [Bacillota bacterium]
MNRMWEIREGYAHDYGKGGRMGSHSSEEEEAYECGFEDGYAKAMEDIKYGERRSMRR